MIDSESASKVSGWLRLGDHVAGVKAVEGRCDECGETGYLSRAADRRLCAGCYLDGEVPGP